MWDRVYVLSAGFLRAFWSGRIYGMEIERLYPRDVVYRTHLSRQSLHHLIPIYHLSTHPFPISEERKILIPNSLVAHPKTRTWACPFGKEHEH